MTIRELTQALAKGEKVCWKNDAYIVQWESLPNGPAIIIRYTANNFGSVIESNEIKDCYIKES